MQSPTRTAIFCFYLTPQSFLALTVDAHSVQVGVVGLRGCKCEGCVEVGNLHDNKHVFSLSLHSDDRGEIVCSL